MARQELCRQQTGFVIVKAGSVMARAADPGIGKLIEAARHLRARAIRDAALADMVLGRAALLVALWAGIRTMHAEVISDGALEEAFAQNLTPTYAQRVPRILNRARNGMCPFEAAATEAAAAKVSLAEIIERLQEVGRNLSQRRRFSEE